MPSLPEEFIDSLAGLLPDDETRSLAASLDTEAPAAVRFNPFKLPSPPEGDQVPWCRYGFYTGERPNFTLDPLHHGGVYYAQEPSSMFIEHIVRELYPDPEGLRILDMCAAPGGKTTLLSTLAGLEGLVVANEVVSQRASVLADNVRRWGLGNTAVTANDPSHYSGIRDFFDIVLVDAPCSGEGMFRKTPPSREEWSTRNIEICAARQKRILSDAWGTLRPGGILIYSTCTFNREENEGNASWLYGNFDCEPVPVQCPGDWGITVESDTDDITIYRFYPHRTKGEGFCATVFRKAAGKARPGIKQNKKSLLKPTGGKETVELRSWTAQPAFMRFATVGEENYAFYAAAFDDIFRLSGSLNIIYSGVHMGRVMKGRLRPEHPLAMFHDVDTGKVAATDVNLETALDYLRKKDIPAGDFDEGYNLVTYNGYPLGWVKKIGARLNNLYPKEQRIMNL